MRYQAVKKWEKQWLLRLNLKRCSKCGEIKLIDEFYFSKKQLASQCKQCEIQRQCQYIKSETGRLKHNLWERKRKKRRDVLAKRREYESQRRNDDIAFRLNANMRSAICNHIKGFSSKANEKWINLVGYTIEDLIGHLTKQFKKGMTWDNYGEVWEIDHVIPKSLFNIFSKHDLAFRKCWALENLQPLWKVENMKKQNRFEGQFQQPLQLIVNA